MNKKNEDQNMSVNTALSTDRQDPGFWREAWQQARLVFYLMRDRKVPFYLKLLPFMTAVYIVSPLDFLPGGLDDVTLLLVGAKVFIELSPQDVVIKHLNHIRALDGYSPIEEAGKEVTAVDAHVIEGEIIE